MIDIDAISMLHELGQHGGGDGAFNNECNEQWLQIADELRAGRSLREWAGETRKAFSTSTDDDFFNDVCKACTAYDRAVGKLP